MEMLRSDSWNKVGGLTLAAGVLMTYFSVAEVVGCMSGSMELCRVRVSNKEIFGSSFSFTTTFNGGGKLSTATTASAFEMGFRLLGASSTSGITGPASVARRTIFSTEACSLCNPCPQKQNQFELKVLLDPKYDSQ